MARQRQRNRLVDILELRQEIPTMTLFQAAVLGMIAGVFVCYGIDRIMGRIHERGDRAERMRIHDQARAEIMSHARELFARPRSRKGPFLH